MPDLAPYFPPVAVILKATQGIGFADPAFAPRVANARAAGLLVGAYHFMDAKSPCEQMANFLSVVGDAGDILLVVDFEVYESSQPTAAQAAAAVMTVKSITGRLPVLYTGRYVLSAPNSMLSQCPLWLAEYGSRPVCPPGWSQWKLWQHTDGRVGSGPMTVPGIGACDRSRFAGTVDELKAWWPAAKA